MKIKIFILITLLFIIQNLYGQFFSISGKITDKTDFSPVEYAGVDLFKNDSVFISKVFSDVNGCFTLNNIAAGAYFVKITFIGYETLVIPIEISDNNINMGNLNLSPLPVLLNEVAVSANSVIIKADRRLVIPSRATVRASTGGLDLLLKMQLPRLIINPVNNEMNVLGGGSLRLNINGRSASNAEIAALNPEDIIRVEYHDDPGARYSDTTVVLDLIVKNRESGERVYSEILQGITLPGYSNDLISLKINRKKSEFVANIYWRYRDLDWTQTREEVYGYPDKQLQHSENGFPNRREQQSLQTSLNYSLIKKGKYHFNAIFRYNIKNVPASSYNRNSILTTSYNDVSLLINDRVKEKNYTPSLDIYYEQNLKNGRLLVFDIAGTYISSVNKRRYREYNDKDPVTDIYSHVKGDSYYFIAEGIYEKNSETDKFTAGLKHKQTYANNIYTGASNADISLKQSESNIYAEYQLKKGRFNYMINLIGARLYHSQGHLNKEKYLLQPSFRIAYAPVDSTYIRYRFNYKGNIPLLTELNDIIQVIDSLQMTRGNPYLKSFYSLEHNLSAGYNRKKLLNIDFMMQYIYQNKPVMGSVFFENEKFIHSYENQRAHHHIRLSTAFKICPWKDYLTIGLTSGVNRYISKGNNYTCESRFKKLDK